MAICSHCSTPLSDSNTGPCPKCEKMGKTMNLLLNDNLSVNDSLTWEKVKTYYKSSPLWLTIYVLLNLCSPFLGLYIVGKQGVLAGLFINAVGFWLGLKAITQIIEREKSLGGDK